MAIKVTRFIIVDGDGDIWSRGMGCWIDAFTFQVMAVGANPKVFKTWYTDKAEAEKDCAELNTANPHAECKIEMLDLNLPKEGI